MNTITVPVKQLQFWGDMPSHTVVILISGKARAGKTSLANYLKAMLELDGHDVVYIPFAKKVKECATKYFGWDGRKNDRGRKLLQEIGRLGRSYDENLWVNFVINEITDFTFPPAFAIIDDWRFPNELEKLQDVLEFITIPVRILRPDSGLTGELGLDISETSLTDEFAYDFFVHNDGTLLDLQYKAKDLINYIYSI